jgi:hypothetical protein
MNLEVCFFKKKYNKLLFIVLKLNASYIKLIIIYYLLIIFKTNINK